MRWVQDTKAITTPPSRGAGISASRIWAATGKKTVPSRGLHTPKNSSRLITRGIETPPARHAEFVRRFPSPQPEQRLPSPQLEVQEDPVNIEGEIEDGDESFFKVGPNPIDFDEFAAMQYETLRSPQPSGSAFKQIRNPNIESDRNSYIRRPTTPSNHRGLQYVGKATPVAATFPTKGKVTSMSVSYHTEVVSPPHEPLSSVLKNTTSPPAALPREKMTSVRDTSISIQHPQVGTIEIPALPGTNGNTAAGSLKNEHHPHSCQSQSMLQSISAVSELQFKHSQNMVESQQAAHPHSRRSSELQVSNRLDGCYDRSQRTTASHTQQQQHFSTQEGHHNEVRIESHPQGVQYRRENNLSNVNNVFRQNENQQQQQQQPHNTINHSNSQTAPERDLSPFESNSGDEQNYITDITSNNQFNRRRVTNPSSRSHSVYESCGSSIRKEPSHEINTKQSVNTLSMSEQSQYRSHTSSRVSESEYHSSVVPHNHTQDDMSYQGRNQSVCSQVSNQSTIHHNIDVDLPRRSVSGLSHHQRSCSATSDDNAPPPSIVSSVHDCSRSQQPTESIHSQNEVKHTECVRNQSNISHFHSASSNSVLFKDVVASNESSNVSMMNVNSGSRPVDEFQQMSSKIASLEHMLLTCMQSTNRVRVRSLNQLLSVLQTNTSKKLTNIYYTKYNSWYQRRETAVRHCQKITQMKLLNCYVKWKRFLHRNNCIGLMRNGNEKILLSEYFGKFIRFRVKLKRRSRLCSSSDLLKLRHHRIVRIRYWKAFLKFSSNCTSRRRVTNHLSTVTNRNLLRRYFNNFNKFRLDSSFHQKLQQISRELFEYINSEVCPEMTGQLQQLREDVRSSRSEFMPDIKKQIDENIGNVLSTTASQYESIMNFVANRMSATDAAVVQVFEGRHPESRRL